MINNADKMQFVIATDVLLCFCHAANINFRLIFKTQN